MLEVRKRGRGFAGMTPEKQRECARAGGMRAHALHRAYTWDSEAAQAAGRKNKGRRWTPEQHERARMRRLRGKA